MYTGPAAFAARCLSAPKLLVSAAAQELSRVGKNALGYCVVLLPGDDPVLAIAGAGVPIAGLPSPSALRKSRFVDPGRVPLGQRDRWVDPVADGFVSKRVAKNVDIASFLAALGVRAHRRQHVCIGPQLVAGLGYMTRTKGAPSAVERARLDDIAAAYRPLLRAAALLAGTVAPAAAPPHAPASAPASSSSSSLTPRQMRIVGLVAEGLTNDQIATRLRVSAHTVKTTLHRLYDKTGARGRIGLVRAVAGRPLSG